MYRLESMRGRREAKKIRARGADLVATAASAEHSNCAHSAGGGMSDVVGAAPDDDFITTNPDASKCFTNRSDVIRAIISSAWPTRLRPS